MTMMLTTSTSSNRMSNYQCIICRSATLFLLLSVSNVVALQGQRNDILPGGVPQKLSSFSSSSKSRLGAASVIDDRVVRNNKKSNRNNNNDLTVKKGDGFLDAWNNLTKLKPLPVPAAAAVAQQQQFGFGSSAKRSSPKQPTLKITRPRGFVEVELHKWVTSISTTLNEASWVVDVTTLTERLTGHPQEEVVTTPEPSPLRQRRLAFRKLKNNMKNTIVPGFVPKQEVELQREVDEALQLQLQLIADQEKEFQQQQQEASNFENLASPSSFQAWQEATSQQIQGHMQTFTESIMSKFGAYAGGRSNSGGGTRQIRKPQVKQATLDDDDIDDILRTSSVLSIESMTESIRSKFGNNSRGGTRQIKKPKTKKSSSPPPEQDDEEDKFSMAQRIESIKCVVAGALSGGVAAAPVTYLHSMASSTNAMAQWELWTDMASLQAALFAIVYRYAVRDDENPMLNQGVIGAFVLARTLSAIQVSETCTAVPLSCKYCL